VSEVGKELKVSVVVYGRLILRGDNVKVETGMLNVSNDSQMDKQYQRKVSDIAIVPDQIASDIARQLGLKLTTEEKRQLTKHYTENPEAYQLYLQGLFYLNKWTEEGFRKAIVYFNQAVEKDPNYGLAYATLADTYVFLGNSGYDAPNRVWENAKTAAMQSVKIDDELP
jgi:hypothetical protein